MGRQPVPWPCEAAGVEGTVVLQTAEHESQDRAEKEMANAGRQFIGARFPLAAAVAAADVTHTFGPCPASSSYRARPGTIVPASSLPMACMHLMSHIGMRLLV